MFIWPIPTSEGFVKSNSWAGCVVQWKRACGNGVSLWVQPLAQKGKEGRGREGREGERTTEKEMQAGRSLCADRGSATGAPNSRSPS